MNGRSRGTGFCRRAGGSWTWRARSKADDSGVDSRGMPDYGLFGDEHVRRYEATGGKVGHDGNGAHCFILHTIGRKSGAVRKFPLIYGRDGEDYVVVASRGGAPENPGWYRNLVAHPDVKIQVRDAIIPVTARTATAEEKRRV